MKNLEQTPNDPNVFRFRDREEGDIVEIEIYYSRGTLAGRRGVFMAIRPAQISPDGDYSRILLAGRSTRIRALERSAPRVLRAVAEAADDRVEEIAAAYREDREAGTTAFFALAASLSAAAAA